MEANVYDITGNKKGTVSLDEKVFGLRYNADLVDQVVKSLMSSSRKNIAHAKDRSEVRGGGKKPWKQKGTGRARHGSIRSPLWVGGGVAHGPRNDKNYERKVSKKMKAKALYTILSQKLRDKEVLFIDSLPLAEAKTKEAVKALKSVSSVKGFENLLTKKNNSAVIALSSKNSELERSFKNLSNVEVMEARNLHPLAILEYKYLVIENPDVALKNLPGKSLLDKKPTTDNKQPTTKKKLVKKVVGRKSSVIS